MNMALTPAPELAKIFFLCWSIANGWKAGERETWQASAASVPRSAWAKGCDIPQTDGGFEGESMPRAMV